MLSGESVELLPCYACAGRSVPHTCIQDSALRIQATNHPNPHHDRTVLQRLKERVQATHEQLVVRALSQESSVVEAP